MIRIHKWSETFETAKTRKLVHLSWLHCPAGVDSSGYIELMTRGVDGIQAFGVFLAICQWSATCPPLIRGSLARSDGKPLQTRQIASILRIPISVAETSIAILCEESVGWLVSDDNENINEKPESATHPPVISQPPATNPPVVSVQGEERSGEDRTEEELSAGAEPAIAGRPQWQKTICDEFNETFGLSCRITPSRVKSMKARWNDPWWRDNWREALTRAGSCSFLSGKNDRGWIIDLAFFLKPDTVTKILEGKYDDRQIHQKPSTTQAREQRNANSFNELRAAAAAAENSQLCIEGDWNSSGVGEDVFG
jgi:hypothetical protein